jgi:hypothetical protein
MNFSTLRFILCCSLMVVFFSCKKEVATGTLQASRSEIVPIEQARKVAIGFASKKFSKRAPADARLSSDTSRAIGSEQVVGDPGDPYFYIFNFKSPGGFVVVSAERNEHPILAYSDKGVFESRNAPYGIVSWMERTKENINYIRQGKFNTQKQASVEWSFAGKEYQVQGLQRIAPIEPGCQEYSQSTVIGPLLTTEWGQGCGYNDLCPTNTSGLRCGHFPTGCVATAMAQVMRYWQTPGGTYNWAFMPSTFADNEVARVMRDAGSAVNMNYGNDGSGAWHQDIPPAMLNVFGFASAQNISYGSSSYMTVQSEISARRPVILSGYNVRNSSWFGFVVEYAEGHEWVCDGYNQTDYYWCNSDGTQGGAGYLYFHMNWGWDGTSNGWYGFDNWAPSGTNFNFQYSRAAIINIHP